jgi:hypothetical protein
MLGEITQPGWGVTVQEGGQPGWGMCVAFQRKLVRKNQVEKVII